MIEFLARLLGKYTYNTFSLVILFWQFQICIFLFMFKHKRRKLFILRLIVCLAVGTVLSWLLAVINTEVTGFWGIFVRVLCYSAVSFLNLAIMFICYNESVVEIFFCWCSGLAMHQVVAKLYPLIQNICGINDRESLSFFNKAGVAWYDWLIWLLFHAVCYVMLSFIFRRRDFLHKDPVTSRNIVLVSVITTIFINGLICVSRLYENESFALNVVVKIFSIAFGTAILLFCTEIFSQNKTRQEMNIINQLWRQEQTQFKSIKANIDFINARCHDLKHIFDKLDAKLNVAEINELKGAIEFYDRNIKTNNEILDVVLCEKMMLCATYGIKLTCLADGSKLSVLTSTQIYSLFGNLIDNAVEAVSKLDNNEKRIISLTVRNIKNSVEINIVNYYENSLSFTDGLPQTEKADLHRHGYGLKSIRYIIEQCKGTLNISADNNMFNVLCSIPFENKT